MLKKLQAINELHNEIVGRLVMFCHVPDINKIQEKNIELGGMINDLINDELEKENADELFT